MSEILEKYLQYLPYILTILCICIPINFYVRKERIPDNSFLVNSLLIIYISILGPITEELFFRDYLVILFDRIVPFLPFDLPKYKCVILAFIFMLAHINQYFIHRNIYLSINQCISVWFLGYILHVVENIYVSFLLHATFNLIISIMIFSVQYWTVTKTGEIKSEIMLIPTKGTLCLRKTVSSNSFIEGDFYYDKEKELKDKEVLALYRYKLDKFDKYYFGSISDK